MPLRTRLSAFRFSGPARTAFGLACAALLPLLPRPAAAQADAAAPALKADAAAYALGPGVLQYAFTFTNPGDSAVFLDCQVPPRVSLEGSALILDFDRLAVQPAPATPASDPQAPPPAPGAAVDVEAFPPQRIGAHQTFQGQRRLDRLLGSASSRPAFTSLRLRMAYFQEGAPGAESAFDAQRSGHVESGAINVARRGKVPPPPKVIRHRIPAQR